LEWIASLLAVIVIAVIACMAAFLAAGRVGKLLGVTGKVVMSRLLGVILAALAAQFVIDGARTAFGS
jgi:multiple antibiotic resistance protein